MEDFFVELDLFCTECLFFRAGKAVPGPIDDPVKCKARVWSYPPPPRIFRGNPVKVSTKNKRGSFGRVLSG